MTQNKELKVAIVHDFLVQYGGAERVLEVLCEMYPEAPIYTLLYDKEKMRGKFQEQEIHTSFLQKFPRFLRQRYKYLLPLMPTAPEVWDLRDFDLVISSSGVWSKGIVTRLNTIHISYLHSPMRFVWDANSEYLRGQKKGIFTNFFSRILLNYIRVWDKVAADRPDYIVANSRYTQERIRKYYGRESAVIYPPVYIPQPVIYNPQPKKSERYFLVVSRLSPYKNVDKIVEAFNKLELPLVVIGEGSQDKYLRKIAGKNVQILGWQSDAKIADYYSKAEGFVFASVDDFGITLVEAMSYGLPIAAIQKGGAIEVMIEGKTGEFFDEATPEVIADGVRRVIENFGNYDREFIVNRAKEFSKERFVRELGEYISSVITKSKIQISNQTQNPNYKNFEI
ncbi:MAG: glycosyltransferase [Parcubacteria group bacterium]